MSRPDTAVPPTSAPKSRVTVALCVLLGLNGCGGAQSTATTTPRPTPPPATPADPLDRPGFRRLVDAERAALTQLLELTTAVRGLPVRTAITARVATSEAVAAHLVATLEHDELSAQRDLYVALGLLPPDVDLEAMLRDVVDEQVVGFYDPAIDALVLRDDVMAALAAGRSPDAEAVVTIAHELVHALQAQHFDLRARMDADVSTDATNAYHALVEGDATLAMIGVAARLAGTAPGPLLDAMPTDPTEALRRMASGEAPELQRVPPIVRIGLTVPYVTGFRLCRTQYDRGGYAAVDAAHRAPPTTTEQVIHPEKFRAAEAALPVELGPLPTGALGGFVAGPTDTLGELELGVLLARGTALDVDFPAAEGWGGDQVTVFRRGEELGAVFVVAFDDERSAARAFGVLERRVQGPERVLRRGRAIGFVRGLPASVDGPLAARLAEVSSALTEGP